MIIYHGSPVVVERPSRKLCRPHNDYGAGFYCTLDKDLACEWACNRPGRDGFCNEYDLDDSRLTVVDLDEDHRGVLAWLAVLMRNRMFDMEWNAADMKERFIERFDVDLSHADVVCGYRADDSYFSIARAFLNGAITDDQAVAALRFGQLGRQVMVKSEKAFRSLHFVGAFAAQSVVWYPRWAKRDADARKAFKDLARGGSATGKRIFELVEG